VAFLESLDMPAYKISSFELVDLPLLRRVARTGKPMIVSTGMATTGEIDEAVAAARDAGASEIALLKCTSAYPASPRDANLRLIPYLAERYQAPVGLSDHTPGSAVALAAVALGAAIVEKHLTLSRTLPTADAAFSSEPAEFKAMVDGIRTVEQSLGRVAGLPAPSETAARSLRRSLFVVADMRQGEVFDPSNVRSIRPGHGLHPRHLSEVLGRRAACAIARGTPLGWQHVDRGAG
jgi:N-acetylneuraminate synthase